MRVTQSLYDNSQDYSNKITQMESIIPKPLNIPVKNIMVDTEPSEDRACQIPEMVNANSINLEPLNFPVKTTTSKNPEPNNDHTERKNKEILKRLTLIKWSVAPLC